jgi:ribosomal-protein-serine acetyltransferase
MFARKLNPGLELRPLQVADAPVLFAVVDAHRASLREWLPWVDATNTITDSLTYIKGTLRDDQETRAFSSGIWSMGRLVGVIGHNRIDWANRVGFPAYWIAPDSAGQGIMTLCCRAVIEHAFAELQLRQLVVAVATGNLRAQKIPLRLGFKHVSVLKKAEWLYDHHVDHFVYSLAAPRSAS